MMGHEYEERYRRKPRERQRLIGIDLGDTCFKVSYLDDSQRSRLVADSSGRTSFPSKVVFLPGGRVRAGVDAEMFGVPENTLIHPMTIAGLTWREVQELGQRYAYRFERRGNQITIDAHRVHPSVDDFLTALFVHAKELAEKHLEETVAGAVVAIPDGSSDPKRIQVHRACEAAGLSVKQLLNQNTAAALGYRLDRGTTRKTIAVVDVGASHTSASIVEGGEDQLETVHTAHCPVGTNNFREKLALLIAERYQHESGYNPRREDIFSALLEEAGHLLIELSSQGRVTAGIGGIGAGGKRLVVDISRGLFQRVIAAELREISETIAAAASVVSSRARIHHVLLVGGGANIPAIREEVDFHFHKTPFSSETVAPAYAAALGAAVKTGILEGTIRSTSVERTVHDLGTFYRGNLMDVLIPKGTVVPVQVSKDYNLPERIYREMVLQWTGSGPGQDRQVGERGVVVLTSQELEVTGRGVRNTFQIDESMVAKFTVTDLGNNRQHILTGFEVNPVTR